MRNAAFQIVENKNQSILHSSFKKNENESLNETYETHSVTAKGTGFNFGNIPIHSSPIKVQPKLKINQPGDQYEQEADAMADKVMRMSDNKISGKSFKTSGTAVQRKCAECQKEDEERKLQRKENSNASGSVAPAIVHDVINTSSGPPLDKNTRSFMELRFNHDFGNVRIHDSDLAAESASSVNALAYTSENNIVFNQGQYNPNTNSGKKLLAHELTHTIQQSGGNNKTIQRFEASERNQISDLDIIITDAATFAHNANTIGGFVEQAGGNTASSATRGVFSAGPSNNPALQHRYLITCRCGMVDMRHFYQMMYIAFEFTNRRSTEAGRSHELNSEATSRFAPEDTPSNALGAFFGSNNFNLFYTSEETFIARLRAFLTRCSPVNFNALPITEQNTIVTFFSQRDSSGVPTNQNETGIPFVLNISSCSAGGRAFPFNIDTSDPERKTIASLGASSTSGLTSDTDIRNFINSQRAEIIQSLPVAEKVRLATRLFSGWVSDEDIDAIEIIYNNSSAGEKISIRGAVNPDSLSDIGQRTRIRALFSH
jgi:Domain of unknown function (DUF4157)